MIRFVCKKSLHWTDWMSILYSFIWFCLNFHLTNWMVEHNRCITRKERKKAILIFRKYTDIPLPDARLGPWTLHLQQSSWDCRNLSRHTWVVIQFIIMDCEQIRRNFKSKEDFGMLCQTVIVVWGRAAEVIWRSPIPSWPRIMFSNRVCKCKCRNYSVWLE